MTKKHGLSDGFGLARSLTSRLNRECYRLNHVGSPPPPYLSVYGCASPVDNLE